MKCVCPAAGWCETHRRIMSELRHRQCRDEPGYFEAFAKRPPPDRSDCRHRGEQRDALGCCGPVWRCGLHKLCTAGPNTWGFADCSACDDYSRSAATVGVAQVVVEGVH
jgi:hypothetical protein